MLPNTLTFTDALWEPPEEKKVISKQLLVFDKHNQLVFRVVKIIITRNNFDIDSWRVQSFLLLFFFTWTGLNIRCGSR